MNYASTKSIADRLAQGLADLREPTVCPYCLERFASRFDDKLKEHMPLLRVDCHALFDACIATLTCPRTSEELERLALTLEDNRRTCATHRVPCRAFKSEDQLDSLMSSSAGIVSMGVRLGENSFEARAWKANKSFADKRGRWPARIEQLFPKGVHATVDVLLGYCELYISNGPLSMLAVMVLVARPAIMPILEQDPFRARFVDVLLKMLDSVEAGSTRRAPWMDRHQGSHAFPCHVTDTLQVLNHGPGAHRNDCSRIFASQESALLRLLGRIADSMDDDNPRLRPIAYCSIDLADHCDEPVPERVNRWFDVTGRCRCKKATAKTVYRLLLTQKSTRVCAGPACSLSTFQMENGKPFQACALCKIPRYCSRACQLAHWKGKGSPPHKNLCAVFCKLNAHSFKPEDLSQFEAVFQHAEPEFSDQDQKALAAFVSSDQCKHAHSSPDA